MRNLITTLILFPTLFIFASFTNDGIRIEPEAIVPVHVQSYREFIQDAYNFRIKNHMEVPSEYYDILGIEDPTTPAWVKMPAVALPPVPKLRDSVPLWIRAGILMTESKSYYKADGTIKYVDKTRGRDVDIGPFQMRRIAFNTVKQPGESFWKLEKDTAYAEELACRYLLYIYNHAGKKSWITTIMKYNVGNKSGGREYLNTVLENGNKI
jgi:hypothetical protein